MQVVKNANRWFGKTPNVEECKQMIRENPKCGRMQADDSGKPRMCDCLSFDGEIEVAKWFLREME